MTDRACNYSGYEFGGGYLDSTCIEGYLWDLDSCDEPGGGLMHGGEWACPRCNTRQFLSDAAENAGDGSCGESMFHPWCGATLWEGSLALAMRENKAETEAFLATLAPFTATDWPDRVAVMEGRAPWDQTIDRTWPWPIIPPPKGR